MNHQLFFFGWETPWLPRLATYLLSTWNEGAPSSAEDLSQTALILPGRRAGRRLLELLALEASRRNLRLQPPLIFTLEEAITTLLPPPPEEVLPQATEWMCHFAWKEALRTVSKDQLREIQPLSKKILQHHSGEYLLPLLESSAQELGNVGLDFRAISSRVEEFFPTALRDEEARWRILADIEKKQRYLLTSWGHSDPHDYLRACLEQGVLSSKLRVLVAGVVECPLFLNSFFQKVDPTIFVIAPREHAAGFNEKGILLPSYWLENPVSIKDDQIIVCERSEDQAEEIARLLDPWTHPDQEVTIAIADPIIVPLLEDRLQQQHLKTRWAAGRPFLGGRFYQLLKVLADFLKKNHQETPSLEATKNLIKHPDLYPHFSQPEEFIKELDSLEAENLLTFLEPEKLACWREKGKLRSFFQELKSIVPAHRQAYSLEQCARELRALLQRLFAQRQVTQESASGHYLLGSLEQFVLALESTEKMILPKRRLFLLSEFIEDLLEGLKEKRIPEREEPGALELLGWLEMSADDAPYAIITSSYEGALPRSPAQNPLLPESLRERLGLASRNSCLARDHYFLQTMTASREVIFLAPRYNPRGEPVRPSRLLMLGAPLHQLPTRVLKLTQRPTWQHREEEQVALTPSSFGPCPLGSEKVTHVTVTSLRTYLQSPRLFYFQHVLKLHELKRPSLEMEASHFGILLHRVLGAFGAEKEIAHEENSKKIAAWLREKLAEIARHSLSSQPSIQRQLERAAHLLDGFAKAQAKHRQEGWKIIAAEQHALSIIEKTIMLEDGNSIILQGRIDRLDWHPVRKKWMIIDYKTRESQAWRKATPNREHFIKKGEQVRWKDFQLPLYLQLAPHWEALAEFSLPLPTLETTDLCYFQLPILATAEAQLSEAFDTMMILPAWEEAKRLLLQIANNRFEDLGEVDPRVVPTLAALCGVAQLS